MVDSPTSNSPAPQAPIDWACVRVMLHGRIAAQIGNCEPQDLEDLIQEGLVRVQRLARREAPRNLDGLVVVVARDVAIDEIRRRQRRRARFVEWEQGRGEAEQKACVRDDATDAELLWFLLLEFFRQHKAPCHELALRYAEHGNWRSAAASLGRGYEAVRQQWARCTRSFRQVLRRNPGPFQDWMNDA